MTSPPAGLREQKKLATRAALSGAALRLSVERGVDRVTVEAIAEAAEVSPRTFFNYFSCKEEAILAGGHAADRMCAALEARPSHEQPVEAVRHAVLSLVTAPDAELRQWVEQVRLVRATPALLPHQLASFVAAEHELAVQLAARTGTGPDDLRPAVAAAALIAAIRVVLRRWLDDERAELSVLLEQAVAQLAPVLDAPRA